MHIIWTLLTGFVVGLFARAVLPGEQRLGWLLTSLLGVVGAFAATYGGQALGWYRAGHSAGFLGSVVGAVVVLFVVSKLRAR